MKSSDYTIPITPHPFLFSIAMAGVVQTEVVSVKVLVGHGTFAVVPVSVIKEDKSIDTMALNLLAQLNNGDTSWDDVLIVAKDKDDDMVTVNEDSWPLLQIPNGTLKLYPAAKPGQAGPHAMPSHAPPPPSAAPPAPSGVPSSSEGVAPDAGDSYGPVHAHSPSPARSVSPGPYGFECTLPAGKTQHMSKNTRQRLQKEGYDEDSDIFKAYELFAAAEAGCMFCVRDLVRAGVDVNTPSLNGGFNAIGWAKWGRDHTAPEPRVSENCSQIVRYLRDHGATAIGKDEDSE